jgi:hypothetical protein
LRCAGINVISFGNYEMACLFMRNSVSSTKLGQVGRMASSGMLSRVTLVRTDVSEELSASFIRATRIGVL